MLTDVGRSLLCGRHHSLGKGSWTLSEWGNQLSGESRQAWRHFSLLLTVGDAMWLAVWSSCLEFPTMMDHDLVAWAEIDPFSLGCFSWGYFITAAETEVGQLCPSMHYGSHSSGTLDQPLLSSSQSFTPRVFGRNSWHYGISSATKKYIFSGAVLITYT